VDNAVFERRGETTRLGSFEIVRKLARGGMAEIFLACTRGPSGFEKLVVLKKILPKYAGNQRFVQLFLEEAKLAASLDHPNVAQVYDIGIVDGSYFFTMEYLHGQDVRSILHRTWRTGERFPIEHAVQIARNVASALHFAHEKQGSDGALLGIVHRDVSPSNIIVTYDGATKLLDFGVAKTTASTVKTRTGALKGKVAYMSPEQARGAPLDRRSDIFSLGVVLWEMVTTQRLFRGENDLATLQLIIHQLPTRPTAVRPECPPELERIVLRALAQDPAARYQTAERLVTDLDELAREHKLKQSSNALSAMISQLFSSELAAWREARAAGVALAEHLNEVGDLTTPVSESDFIELDPSADDGDDDDELEPLEPLYGSDPEDDDDEKTEHVPLFGESLAMFTGEPVRSAVPDAPQPPPAARSPYPTPNAPLPQVAGPRATPSAPFAPVTPHAPVGPLAPVTGSPATLLGPLAPATGSPATLLGPLPPVTGPHPTQSAEATDPSATPTVPLAPTGSATMASAPPPMTGPHPTPSGAFPAAGPHPTPSGAFPPAGPYPQTPSGAFPAAGLRAAPNAPFTGSPAASNAAFAIPPWQSGQPSGPPTERIARSWAVIDLPAFAPEVFERQRRIVLRVAGGLVGVILLLAIIAGRC
jgi:serine/threonine protein kinase